MFRTITDRLKVNYTRYDDPARVHRLDCLRMVLDATLYDTLSYRFHEDRSPGDQHIPEHQRAPHLAEGIGLAGAVVSMSAAFLFDDSHWPQINTPDPEQRQNLELVVHETNLVETMREAVHIGSVGSVAVAMRITKGILSFAALDTRFLTPSWDPNNPYKLAEVVEKRILKGYSLRQSGYNIADDDLNRDYWYIRRFDSTGEWWYQPLRLLPPEQQTAPVLDNTRSVQHNLGFVPIVWIKNLPGGDEYDGLSTFANGVSGMIAIDYSLSRSQRVLKFQSDPTLVVKEPSLSDQEISRSAQSAIIVSEDGDVKLLEIDGNSVTANLNQISALRAGVLDAIGGVKADPEKVAMATSGRALELLFQPMLMLTSNLRQSYGERGLLKLLRLVVRARQQMDITLDDDIPLPPLAAGESISLKWPAWFPVSEDESLKQATAMQTRLAAGIISRRTAISDSASQLDIPDVDEELRAADSDRQEDDQRQLKLAAASKPAPGAKPSK